MLVGSLWGAACFVFVLAGDWETEYDLMLIDGAYSAGDAA
jgi:hypothetical protein